MSHASPVFFLVLLATQACLGAGEDSLAGEELVLSAEKVAVRLRPNSEKKIIEQTDTWKLDWENYWYKDFLPSMRERYPDRRPPLAAHQTLGGENSDLIASSGHVLRARFMRFFKKPDDTSHKKARGNEEILIPDWRGYDLLWMDLQAGADTHVWWAIEDREIHPPITAHFDLKAGEKVTLEIDLGLAVKERRLNLADLWYSWVFVNKAGTYTFSNLRLVKRGAKAGFPVLRDPKATRLPDYPAPQGPPEPDLARDTAPLPAPVKITYRRPDGRPIGLFGQYYSSPRTPTAAVAAYDPQRILLLYQIQDVWGGPRNGQVVEAYRKRTGKEATWDDVPLFKHSYLHAVQTLDGGKTWSGINGEPDPTPVAGIYRSPAFSVDPASVILFNEEGCNAHPGPRERINKFTFHGSKGWTFNEKMYVIGDESVHCGHPHDAQDFVRVPSGRIWGAYMIEGRWLENHKRVQAKFSDTDGVHWHSWEQGMSASVPGVFASRPVVTPFRDQVAVLFDDQWTYFDGQTWSEHAAIPGGEVKGAATLGRERIVVLNEDGMYSLSGNAWKKEWSRNGKFAALNLCQSGERLMLIGLTEDRNQVLVHRRNADGTWSGPEAHATSGELTSWHIPRFAPPNCGIFAGGSRDRSTIEILLVPTGGN